MEKNYQYNFEGFTAIIAKLRGLLLDTLGAVTLPYRKQESILTPAERRFYQVLLEAVEGRATITPKVGLQDVFVVTDEDHPQAARNRISQRHVDFLVCEAKTLHPLFGVELDDRSHNEIEKQKRDEFKNDVFEAALLPLVRIPVTYHFDLDEVRRIIEPYFMEKEKPAPPICPNCQVPMVIKTARYGKYKGLDFYSCPNFPRCKEKQDI